MSIDNREDYIRYRFQRAEESFDDALILLEKKKWNAIINRLYYSCFYAVIALLLKNNIETQTHEGARTQFGLRFVKNGIRNMANYLLNCLITDKKGIMEMYSTMMRN